MIRSELSRNSLNNALHYLLQKEGEAARPQNKKQGGHLEGVTKLCRVDASLPHTTQDICIDRRSPVKEHIIYSHRLPYL